MPLRYRPDALSLHVNEIRKMLPVRRIAHLVCPTCGERRQQMFLHPDNPGQWMCKEGQQFTIGRNGRYGLSALARARGLLQRIARQHRSPAAAQDAQPPAQPKRTRKAAPVG
jgi:hypothetical protein